ncbi:unnamed protein product [Trypanosoma congolense IL3000]|uniref:WGS project CAEQ00000000 data, annotated contig 837 n=1 Tax=Trypanosoma congolense (strain IL3000) TaxID=1068625 RepID=F9WIV7_TRYCI|nr:unnamed protein product [Trypanosoma congolense IL3000]
MAGESRLFCRLLAWFLMCSVGVLGSFYRKSVPTEAGETICSLSRKLKEVAPWTQEKVAALRKTRDEYVSKILDWQLHFQGSPGCGGNESLRDKIRTILEKVNEEIKTLPTKSIRAGALAAKSAGRLDEFITVFANAGRSGVFGTTNYCLGNKGDPARRRDLLDCFPEGNKLEIGETNLAKIPESMTNEKELNLTAALTSVNHSAVEAYFNRIYGEDIHADCNLIKGTAGGIIGSVNLEKPLWWGGGVLTIGKDFPGEIKREKFISGGIENASTGSDGDKAFWTENPSEKVPHLQKSLAAFQAFNDAAARITQKFAEIEKIEKQIEFCLSNETMEEGPTQSCFKSAVKLNAELQAANALLARYYEEKGPLPPEGALILHQSVANVLYLLFAFLL